MIQSILSRLKKVKKTRNGEWIACCPAHDDKSPSLAVKVADNGNILMHCFGGCEIESIANSLQIDLQDLFAEKEYQSTNRDKITPYSVLQVVKNELYLVVIAASDLQKGKTLSDEDKKRFDLAVKRLMGAVNYVES